MRNPASSTVLGMHVKLAESKDGAMNLVAFSRN